MPFDLKNAPSPFHRAIDVILSTIKWQFALIYLEDILILSKLVHDQHSRLCSVLGLFCDTRVLLWLKKGFFFDDKIDFLRHITKPGKLNHLKKGK